MTMPDAGETSSLVRTWFGSDELWSATTEFLAECVAAELDGVTLVDLVTLVEDRGFEGWTPDEFVALRQTGRLPHEYLFVADEHAQRSRGTEMLALNLELPDGQLSQAELTTGRTFRFSGLDLCSLHDNLSLANVSFDELADFADSGEELPIELDSTGGRDGDLRRVDTEYLCGMWRSFDLYLIAPVRRDDWGRPVAGLASTWKPSGAIHVDMPFFGVIDLTIEELASAPGPDLGNWEDVVEMGLQASEELPVTVSSLGFEVEENGPPVILTSRQGRSFRLRISAKGRDNANHKKAVSSFQKLKCGYLIQIWPDDYAAPLKLRSSSNAAEKLSRP